jgi:hypothetical protein
MSYEDAWECGGIAPLFIISALDGVVGFKPRLIFSRGKSPSRPQRQPGLCEEKNRLTLLRMESWPSSP